MKGLDAILEEMEAEYKASAQSFYLNDDGELEELRPEMIESWFIEAGQCPGCGGPLDHDLICRGECLRSWAT